MAQLIDGKAIAAKVRAEVGEAASRLRAVRGVSPGLAVIRVGEDPASKTYVANKRKVAEELDFLSWEFHYSQGATRSELLERVALLNADPSVHGILIQLPLPKELDSDEILSAIDPAKDVDGFHPVNAGKLFLGRKGVRPCTPAGIMRLLEEIGVSPQGKRAVVVGRSQIVGRPMAMLLLAADATVTICHRQSDLPREVGDADILVVAAGAPELVKGAWVKPGSVVIDVGMNRSAEGKLVGDVEFAEASRRAAYITPVPGGVGPMTVAMLMHNTVVAAFEAK